MISQDGHRPSIDPPGGGVELSENKLRAMAEALHGPDPMGRRNALRLPVEGFVTIAPLPAAGVAAAAGAGDASDAGGSGDASQRIVGVYDLSRSGIAIVDQEPIAPGTQFNVRFAREAGLPIEVLCTARHTRRQGDAWITGCEFGVSWLAALSAAVTPPPVPAH
jgi:hypothetical protein